MKNIRNIIVIAFLVILPFMAITQVSVNNDGSPPDPSAMLEVKSAIKGFLPPRIALTSANSPDPVTSPAAGLLIYNTATAGTSPYNVMPGYYFWNGAQWASIAAPQGTNPGDMLYWDGTQWVVVPAGSNGQVLTFNNGLPTWGGVQLPMLSTTGLSNIITISANSGGNIVSDGGAPVTVRGVCWSINPYPTTADYNTSDGSGIGTFVSSLTGLNLHTTYYVRAYATNSAGTAYGNQLSFTTPYFYIGQSHEGGIIFYIDPSDQHGLIAATSDQSTDWGAEWGCASTIIGGTYTAIGTGQANTNAILAGCSTSGIAARICDQYSITVNTVVYDDWFLPSKDELNQMYLHKDVIGDFYELGYWSSSEHDAIQATIQQFFGNGYSGWAYKAATEFRVRAVRFF